MLSLANFGLPLTFANPLMLLALLSLPIIWYLLRLTPPKPVIEPFPPIKILAQIVDHQETPDRSPWWLTLLRLLMAALVIFAMSAPSWNSSEKMLSGKETILLIVDDGWASGSDWNARLETIKAIADEASADDRQIAVLKTTPGNAQQLEIISAQGLTSQYSNWKNKPLTPDYETATKILKSELVRINPDEIIFLSDGISHPGIDGLKTVLNSTPASKVLFTSEPGMVTAITQVQNDPDAMIGTLIRSGSKSPQIVSLIGFDQKGASVTRQTISFEKNENTVNFEIKLPVELRNDIIRLEIEKANNAGAVKLLDESNRRRLVGLISGEKHDNSQPLLSPLYYISRALEPFSDVRKASDANVDTAVPDLINQGVSAIFLADIGTLNQESTTLLSEWIAKGGMLVRFAGPRLAANPQNDLMPVKTRTGDRNIGGALSWEKPKAVAAFELQSPFFGLSAPHEVFVSRQVLALQDENLSSKTWASLVDGTPLVTAQKTGRGWIVLFHVNSDTSWSNLPISGTFVEMLRRIVNQSRSSGTFKADTEVVSLPPYRILDGKGRLGPPDIQAHPLKISKDQPPKVNYNNHPGFYGTSDGLFALNLLDENSQLMALEPDFLGNDARISSYELQHPVDFKPYLLFMAALLFAIDCLIVLMMAGLFGKILTIFNRTKSPAAIAGAFALISVLSVLQPPPATAQDTKPANTAQMDEKQISSALKTRLAYVITGVREIDQISRAGLFGLSLALKNRTAIEPGDPIGIDIASDELAFYPMIYWPIHTASNRPDNKTMARIDAFMKQGGSILFDTRDQNASFTGSAANSPEAQYLQDLLANLDIPPLEPVPSDHVLTKSFFILNQFPGRYAGGQLWIEQLPPIREGEARPARSGDGVSSILITSNDLAAAWAVDATLSPLFPTIPPNPIQREMAFRVGINLIMYAMTGNYKADQVHIPALLKRLGQ